VYSARRPIVVNHILNHVCFTTVLFWRTVPEVRSMVGHNCMSIKTSPRQVGRSRQLINTASQTCLYGKSGSVRPLNKQQHTAFAGGVGLGVCIMCHHRLHLMVTALFRTAQPGPAIVNTQHGFLWLSFGPGIRWFSGGGHWWIGKPEENKGRQKLESV
jgi:hypothetical protein